MSVIRTRLLGLLLVALCASSAVAWQPPAAWNRAGDRQFPANEAFRHRAGRAQPAQAPYSYGQLQRPYPYHLDYYRMMYGGSYAPYFGNLYGPPVYQNFPTFPAYGGFGGAFYW